MFMALLFITSKNGTNAKVYGLWLIANQIVIYLYNGILFNSKKEKKY